MKPNDKFGRDRPKSAVAAFYYGCCTVKQYAATGTCGECKSKHRDLHCWTPMACQVSMRGCVALRVLVITAVIRCGHHCGYPSRASTFKAVLRKHDLLQ